MMSYRCRDEVRLRAVKRAGVFNGIEYLEVSASTLTVQLLKPAALTIDEIRIDGVEIFEVTPVEDRLLVRVKRFGDAHVLRIVGVAGFDPRLSEVAFSFRADCPSEMEDCRPTPVCPSPQQDSPVIDYLARDYPSFRQMLLDRLSLTTPQWTERSPADLGVALVELLAYVGDRLTYRQDAIAAEAYLGTARRRVSVRRHARLIDYRMHDGAAARAFVQVNTAAAEVVLPAGTQITTTDGAVVFETVAVATLHQRFAQMPLYTWGEPDCCLPAGATRATLHGAFALTGDELLVLADAQQRWPVRLTSAQIGVDEFDGLVTPIPVTDIEWHTQDALPFPLRVAQDGRENAVAWGNIVVAGHGRTIGPEQLAPVGSRYRPTLSRGPLTQRVEIGHSPASAVLRPRAGVPDLTLHGAGRDWTLVPDLLASGRDAADYVVETEDDATAMLRFGDDVHGRSPETGDVFTARYRIGNGQAGNVGAGSLTRVVTGDARITGATNPLPAAGGIDPEQIHQVRRDAPEAYRVQQRAVTADDYAEVSQRLPEVQRAVATFRWTGSWHTVFVTTDPMGGGTAPGLETRLRDHLERFRMAGYDLEADPAREVPVELALAACVHHEHFRSDVYRELVAAVRGLFHPDNLTIGQPVYLSVVIAAAHAVAGVQSVQAKIFQRRSRPGTQGLTERRLGFGRLEVPRLDVLKVEMGGGK